MLFRKKVDPMCAYCKRSAPVGEDQVICIKKGVMELDDHCGAFQYDPLKRVPARPVKLSTEKLTAQDFEI